MSDIKINNLQIVPLGAGQDVGRSCILVSIGGKNIMLDCGMHMGYQDDRRFPDFSYTEFRGDTNFFTSAHIKACMKKQHSSLVGTRRECSVEYAVFGGSSYSNYFVIAVNLHEMVQVDRELSIRAFYAGHVLGAAMFEVRVGNQSVLYTGDYNMTPDRHLGAARVLPGLRPDLLISESTYATTIRDSKRARERDFLKKVHDRVVSGGKVGNYDNFSFLLSINSLSYFRCLFLSLLRRYAWPNGAFLHSGWYTMTAMMVLNCSMVSSVFYQLKEMQIRLIFIVIRFQIEILRKIYSLKNKLHGICNL
uniref:Lactamase_B domain-containing protein n=1 Tax=Heterorhabditis bacteriophora TaxID=37862 RepID=A0A1I7WMB7_HETBA